MQLLPFTNNGELKPLFDLMNNVRIQLKRHSLQSCKCSQLPGDWESSSKSRKCASLVAQHFLLQVCTLESISHSLQIVAVRVAQCPMTSASSMLSARSGCPGRPLAFSVFCKHDFQSKSSSAHLHHNPGACSRPAYLHIEQVCLQQGLVFLSPSLFFLSLRNGCTTQLFKSEPLESPCMFYFFHITHDVSPRHMRSTSLRSHHFRRSSLSRGSANWLVTSLFCFVPSTVLHTAARVSLLGYYPMVLCTLLPHQSFPTQNSQERRTKP